MTLPVYCPTLQSISLMHPFTVDKINYLKKSDQGSRSFTGLTQDRGKLTKDGIQQCYHSPFFIFTLKTFLTNPKREKNDSL